MTPTSFVHTCYLGVTDSQNYITFNIDHLNIHKIQNQVIGNNNITHRFNILYCLNNSFNKSHTVK